jgi:hypothetical protein
MGASAVALIDHDLPEPKGGAATPSRVRSAIRHALQHLKREDIATTIPVSSRAVLAALSSPGAISG